MQPVIVINEKKAAPSAILPQQSKVPTGNNISPTIAGKQCPVCGNLLLIPSGSCYVCQACGTSDGCS